MTCAVRRCRRRGHRHLIHATGTQEPAASVLFTGDIQVPTERELMQLAAAAGPELHADVLVVPHHGSAEASTAKFLRAVAPEAIVSSDDRRLSHKQHEFDRLAAGTPLYRTHERGAITVATSRQGELSVRTFLPRRTSRQSSE